jgi:hypothetical protein
MPLCQSVLSVSPQYDLVHDRTQNGLNAGCAIIVEDNLAHRSLFRHGENALFFRYDDDSLQECLRIVCEDPGRSCALAQAGFALRDAPQIQFGEFPNLLKLAREQARYLAGRNRSSDDVAEAARDLRR